ncbi:flippase-like domain-containing protein [Candidatus Saccharibacteria bacterium]|jgi:uncharacterized protein (TIRG00374 family)|nr:flippase-like domain-containing protein [Candidatus Saccharibacteria bacterium]
MKKTRAWLIIIAVVALAVLLFASRHQLADAWQLTKQVNIMMLIFLVLVSRASSFFWLSKFYQKSFLAVGYDVEQKELAKDSIATNFVNTIFPSAGISGTSWLSVRLKDQYSVPYGVTALIQLLRYMFNLLAFLVLLIISFVVLMFVDDLSLIAVSLTIILMMFTTSTILNLLFIMRGTSFVNRSIRTIANYLNLIVKIITFSRKQKIIDSQKINDKLESFNYQYKKLEQKSKEFKATFKYMLLFTISEFLSIYVVFVALNQLVNPAKVFVVFGLSNAIASLFAFIPAGLGVFETVMSSTFAMFGLSRALSLSVTLIYRLMFITTLAIPGLYYYRRIGKKNNG